MSVDLLGSVLLLGVFLLVLFVSVALGMGLVWLMLKLASDMTAQRTSRERQRREALEELGLARVQGGTYGGRVDGVEVRYQAFEIQERHNPHTAHHWQISVPSGSLYVGASGVAGEDVRLGDARFDARFKLRGRSEDLALLDARVRELLMALPSVWIQDGKLGCKLTRFDVGALAQLQQILREMLRAPAAPDERMRRMVTDPVAGVRLLGLAQATELDPALGRALATLLQQDDDPSVRGLASVILREEGLEEMALSKEVSLEYRAWALRVLAQVGSTELRLRLGRALLGQSLQRLQLAAVALLCSAGPEGEPALLEGVPSAESELLGAILLALREVGTVAAVPVLRERQGKLSVLQAGLSKAIDHAVLAIQEQAGGERGGLALAGTPSQQGALAVVGVAGALAQAQREHR